MSFNALDISGFKFTSYTQINNSLNNGLSPDYSFYGGINTAFDELFFIKYANCTVEDISFGNNATTVTEYPYSDSASVVDISLGYLLTNLSDNKFNNYVLTDMVVDTSNVYACGFVNDSNEGLDRGFIYSFDLCGNVNDTFTGGVEGISGYFVMDTSGGKVASRYRSIYRKENALIVGGEWINNPDASNISILLQSITLDASYNQNWGFPNGSSQSLIPYNYQVSEEGYDLSGLPLSNLTSYSINNSDQIIFFANAEIGNNFYTTGYNVDPNTGNIIDISSISVTGLTNLVVKSCIDNWIEDDGSIFIGGDTNVDRGYRRWYIAKLDGSFNFMADPSGNTIIQNEPDISGTIINYLQLIPGSSSTVITGDSLFVSLYGQYNTNPNMFTLFDLNGNIEIFTNRSISNSTNYIKSMYNDQILYSDLDANQPGTLQNEAIHLYECSDGLRIVQIGAYINSTNPSLSSNLIAPRLGPICFQKGTKIHCDQGIIKIENIIPNKHTINGKSINFITKTIHTGEELIKFKKDCFAPNRPSEDLICSPEHKIHYKNKLVEAKDFVKNFVDVITIKNNKEVLYNILMDEHEIIVANNIPVESLHPNNLIAVLNSNYNNKEIKDLCLKKIGNINNYNKSVKKINEPNKVKFDIIKRNKHFN